MSASRYGHFSIPQLETLRDSLIASLTKRLTAPTEASGTGRTVKYQQSPDEIRSELNLVAAEIEQRNNPCSARRGPIYLA
jgi:hypothetical protein